MENNLSKQLEDYFKQKELESQNKLEFIQKSFIKKEHNRILTCKIEGDNEVVIQTGEVGEYVKSVKLNFENDTLRNNYINQKVNELSEQGYQKVKFDDSVVLFVQIHPPKNKTNNLLDVFDKYEELQEIFDKPIYERHIGYFATSDLGAGVNLLYNIWDEKKGVDVIMEVINSNQLAEQTIIAKRIYKTEQDWDYQIIYPKNFNGIFNSL